jgi:hypothetical protein
MKRALLLLLLAAGCGGSESPKGAGASHDLGVSDPFVGDLASNSDFNVGRYSCLQTLDAYCAQVSCVRQLSDALQPNTNCIGLGSRAVSCGSYVYVEDYLGGVDGGAITDIQEVSIYDAASGQLVAVLGGGIGSSDTQCLAGPTVFIDPQLLDCPLDGGAPVPICPPTNGAPCGGLARKCV